jgi:hypothetical protein
MHSVRNNYFYELESNGNEKSSARELVPERSFRSVNLHEVIGVWPTVKYIQPHTTQVV